MKKVLVVKTTSYQLLDDAAIMAVQKWRFKPHTIERFYVPVSFSLAGWMADELRAARAHTTFAPAPVRPFSTWMNGVGGDGRFQLRIDLQTGRVTDVKILESTRDGRLDEAGVKAFRQWRFAPHTVDKVTIRVSF